MDLDVKVVGFTGAPPARPAPSPVPAAATPAAVPGPGKGDPPTAARTSDQLRQAIDALSSRLKPNNTNLNFRVDSATNRVVVSIVDVETGAVLRQIPAEELMRVAQNLQKHPREHRGALLDERA